MSDYNNRPAYLIDALQDYFEQTKTPRTFWHRVRLWLSGWHWSRTKWRYETLHGLSTETYAKWAE